MTTTIGAQFRPYVEENPSTQEKEAVPCDFTRIGPHDGSLESLRAAANPCTNEATHTGLCPGGDRTMNACEECLDALNSGTYRTAKGTRIAKDPIHECSHVIPMRHWTWVKR
jgi:hypothetical protein